MRLRSWLFTPGDRPERFAKALQSEADVVILDLEDAVAPAAKDAARRHVLEAMASGAGRPTTALRISPLHTRDGLLDMLAVIDAPRQPDLILLPKAEAPVQIAQLRTLLRATSRPPALCALVESAAGMIHVPEIARSGVCAVAFGAADYAADITAPIGGDGVRLARTRLVEAAAAAGVPAIDAPCFSLKDPEAIAREAREARSFGFAGKLAIHPAQVAELNATFSPAPEEIEWAKRVLDENTKGAGSVDGQLVDEAVARRARFILTST